MMGADSMAARESDWAFAALVDGILDTFWHVQRIVDRAI